MTSLILSKISLADLRNLVVIREQGVANYEWLQVDQVQIDEAENRRLKDIQSHLLNYQTHLMNEATIWSRAIYPLLLLAEKPPIQAWAEVALTAHYKNFDLDGMADGVLGKCVAGYIEAPYLVVVEAKRGLEAQNPQFQLYGQLLAAARINWETDHRLPQEIYGCYTIADTWTFIRGEITDIETDKPIMQVEASREYAEKLEAEIILKILKRIVDKRLRELLATGLAN
jgi:hypothetical protein